MQMCRFMCVKGNMLVTWQSSEGLHLRALLESRSLKKTFRTSKKMTKFHRAISQLPHKDDLCKNFVSSRVKEVWDFFL